MIYKIPTSQPGLVCVVFELPSCVWADRIVVSGTFNNWDERAVTMHQDRDGVWRARLELPIGQRYEFRYLIDGRWQTDYHADGFMDNGYRFTQQHCGFDACHDPADGQAGRQPGSGRAGDESTASAGAERCCNDACACTATGHTGRNAPAAPACGSSVNSA